MLTHVPLHPVPPGGRICLAAVGSGGKTSCLTDLARRYRQAGYSVLLTTTTHMWATQASVCSPRLAPLEARLRSAGLLVTGTPVPGGKLAPLPPDQFRALAQQAQVTLVEADGSRGLPLKMPAPWEPALPDHPTHVLVVQGLSALGRPLDQVCHRWDLAAAALGASPQQPVTPALCSALLELGYLGPLRQARLPCSVLLNQGDTASPEEIQAIQQALARVPVTVLSLRQAAQGLTTGTSVL